MAPPGAELGVPIVFSDAKCRYRRSPMSALGQKLTSIRFGTRGRQHIVRRHRTADALQVELTHRFDCHGLLNRLPNAWANQDLTGLGFIAKSGRNVGYCSDRGIVEAALKSNRAERRKTMCYAYPESQVVTKITPFLNHSSDCSAHI